MGFRGVLVPVLTPFRADLSPDAERFLALCRHLLAEGAAGLAVFGTTSEANSLSAGERKALLEMLVENGVPADKLMPGTGACSITEAAELSGHAAALGCGGVLMLPPFYYKGVADDGVYAFVDTVIDRVGSDKLKVYLYHIPPVAQVGYSLDVVGRLASAHPDTVVGLKDSSGDWSNTAALLDAYPQLEIFPGSEVFLLDGLRKGGAGCITATGNVAVPSIKAVFDGFQGPDADEKQANITAVRKRFQETGPMVPVLKAYIAKKSGDAAWTTVRPPMVAADADAVAALDADLQAMGFSYAAPGA